MTASRTDGMSPLDKTKQSDRDWSPKSESNVVTRTASFGHGQHGPEVCARKNGYDILGKDNQIETRKGLQDDVIIPLGLMATLRRKMRTE
jgi:hypothetical protein